jgi:hypothetical protein
MAEGDDAGKGRGTPKAKAARRVKRRRSTADGDIFEDVYSEPPPRPAPTVAKTRQGNPLDAYRDRMGKVSDDVIASEAGVSRAMVGGYRRRFSIAAYAGYKWQKGVGPPHRAKGSGRKAAAGSGKGKSVSAAGGRRRRKGKSTVLEGFLADLGKLPDDVIADRAGLSRGVVGRYRRERGIEAYDGYKFQDGHAPLGAPAVKRGPGRPKGSRNKARPGRPPKVPGGVPARRGPRGKLEPFADLIGTVPDAEVAALAGVSRPSVATWRHRRGIAPAARVGAAVRRARAAAPAPGAPKRRGRPPGSKNKPKIPAVLATVSTARPGAARAGMRAFAVVVVRGQQRAEFITVGSSVVDAAERVTAALSRRSGGAWVIDELRALGLAL